MSVVTVVCYDTGMTQMTSTLAPTNTVEQHDGYTLEHYAPIQIGGTTFTVRRQRIDITGESYLWLTGPRGGDYILQPHRPSQGVYVAQSFKSGQPMRRAGNLVLIHWFGDLIEQV